MRDDHENKNPEKVEKNISKQNQRGDREHPNKSRSPSELSTSSSLSSRPSKSCISEKGTSVQAINRRDVVNWVEKEGSNKEQLEKENKKLKKELHEKQRDIVVLTLDGEEMRKKVAGLVAGVKEKRKKQEIECGNVVAKLKEERVKFQEEIQKKDSLIAGLTSTVENLKTTKGLLEKEKGNMLRLQKSLQENVVELQAEVEKVEAENSVLKEVLLEQKVELENVWADYKVLCGRMKRRSEIMEESYQRTMEIIAIKRQELQIIIRENEEIFGAKKDTTCPENRSRMTEKAQDIVESPAKDDSEEKWESFFVGDSDNNRQVGNGKLCKRRRLESDGNVDSISSTSFLSDVSSNDDQAVVETEQQRDRLLQQQDRPLSVNRVSNASHLRRNRVQRIGTEPRNVNIRELSSSSSLGWKVPVTAEIPMIRLPNVKTEARD